MTVANPSDVFHLRGGEGWLILAGSIPELGGRTAGLMDRLLAHLDLSRPIAAVVGIDAEPAEVQDFLETLEEWLGTEAGVLEADTDLEVPGWEDSGLLMLIGDDREAWMEALAGSAGDRLDQAFTRGAIILAVGGASGLFGMQWISAVRPDALVPGLDWLPSVMVLTDPGEAHGSVVRSWLQGGERRAAILLDPGSVLALGPGGAVEAWSDDAPEVLLGTGWAAV